MQSDWKIGERIENRWEIHKILRGGMGIVYVVYDYEFREPFAVKTFQDEVFAHNPGIADRFTLEARSWVNLDSHQNVVRALYVERIRGKPFLFLEYVSGGDLHGWIGTPRLTKDLPQVLRFAIQFCDGMNHALSKGIIQAHRDVKPQNCLVTEDNNLKVTDFGLAKVFDDTRTDAAHAANFVTGLGIHLSRTGNAAGTCTHMAPEQFADAKHVDVRADVYSFGVMLFQMVRGRLPFEGRTWEDFARLHSKAAPPPLESGESALDSIVGKCLAKVAGERYAEFGVLREELASIYESNTKQPAPKPASGRELNAYELVNKGTSLEGLGRSEEALACYDRALALNPQVAAAWLNKGLPLTSLGRFEEALASYDRALALNPQYAKAWTNKGHVLMSLGRSEEALASYDRALDIAPQYAKAWTNKGNALERLGRHGEALASYDRTLAANPQDAEVWNNKGIMLMRLGRHEEALACYDRALAANPLYAEAWNDKGVALMRLGRHEEALACYDRALDINPQFADAWLNKGVGLRSLGRYEEALNCYDRGLAINPQDAEVWNNKGNTLVDLRRYEEALACYDRALALNPRNADVWSNKGNALWGLGRSDEVLACYDRALDINPKFAKVSYNKGVILAKAFSNCREALPCFEQAHRLGHPDAARAIAACRKALGTAG